VRPSIVRNLVAALAGALFGAGLVIAQMTSPAKVLAFLDLAGSWDPTLAVVMGAALVVALPAFRLMPGAGKPFFDTRFYLPGKNDPDRQLVLGALIFGLGWGLAGLCPGPALVGLVSGHTDPWIFVIAMLAGSALARRFA
jgi:uncharacterized protein